MIKGIGTDIIEISRVNDVISRQGNKFLNRLFTLKERDYCSAHHDSHRHFAGRFAAKEAIVKALGTGFGSEAGWLDIEILNDPDGKPVAHLSESIKERFNQPQILLSISHCKQYAQAVAIWLYNPKG